MKSGHVTLPMHVVTIVIALPLKIFRWQPIGVRIQLRIARKGMFCLSARLRGQRDAMFANFSV
jgi:hypothetical protein